MPTGTPVPIQMMPAQINVPTANGLFVTVSIQGDGSPEATALVPAAVQQVVDLFQGWSGRHPAADVTGQLYDATLAAVTPTDPIPAPEPPEEPPADFAPSTVV